jgi:hypothetical protein
MPDNSKSWRGRLRRIGVLVMLVSFLAICSTGSRAGAETWEELLARADSLSEAQSQDSTIFVGKLALKKAQAKVGSRDTITARVLCGPGLYYYDKLVYDQADTLYRQALAIRERIPGPDHLNTADYLNILNFMQARFDDAV